VRNISIGWKAIAEKLPNLVDLNIDIIGEQSSPRGPQQIPA
jgi:hypothetical protein